MKKKMAAVVVTGALCLIPNTAFAEGKLEVTEKNLILYSEEDGGVFFAKVENTGDEAVGIGTGELVITSEAGDELLTDDYISSTPSFVEVPPGDSLYVREDLWDSGLEGATIGNYELTMETWEVDGVDAVERVSCEASFDVSGEYGDCVRVTFTNNTEDLIEDFTVVAWLYDEDDNLIFVSSSMYGALAVHGGSTITDTLYIDGDLVEYYEEKGITPARAEAVVYYESE